MAPPPLDTNTAPQDEPAADEALSQETLDRIAAAEILDGFDVLVRDVAFELMIGDDLEVLREPGAVVQETLQHQNMITTILTDPQHSSHSSGSISSRPGIPRSKSLGASRIPCACARWHAS